MRARRVLALGFVVALLASIPHASPASPPAVEIHRTAEGRHLDIPGANPLFILVIGSDIREGDPRRGRADGLSLIAVNTVTRRATIVGIPRDSWVNVPGHGHRKILASLNAGGPELTVQTVQQLTGLPIHLWATVEFSRFQQLVDRLGGVSVPIPYRFADPMSGAFFEPPGPADLDGAAALAFARARRGVPGGDFGRQENIARLLRAGLVKLQHDAEQPVGLLRYMDVFGDLVISNVPARDLLHLGAVARRIDPEGVAITVLPGTTGSAAGQSVVFLSPQIHEIFDAIREDGEL